MKFTKEYSKLKKTQFTTIRRNTTFYKVENSYIIKTPCQEFRATVISLRPINKIAITDGLALADADTNAPKLRTMLEQWYGKHYDNFVLITLRRDTA